MLDTVLAQQLLDATNARAALVAGTPAELPLRARARQIAGALAVEDARIRSIEEAKSRRASAAVAEKERLAELSARYRTLARYEDRIGEMVSDLRHAGVTFEVNDLYRQYADLDEVARSIEVHDALRLVHHEHCGIDLTRTAR